jgi:hypothetical protein
VCVKYISGRFFFVAYVCFLLVLRFFPEKSFYENFPEKSGNFPEYFRKFSKKWKIRNLFENFRKNFRIFPIKNFPPVTLFLIDRIFGKILVILHITCHCVYILDPILHFFFIQMQCTNQFQNTIY